LVRPKLGEAPVANDELQHKSEHADVVVQPRGPNDAAVPPKRQISLPTKLLFLTLLFVMLAEVLIFLPSIANFRLNWLNDRLTASHLAALAAEAVPDGTVPATVRMELLRTAQVRMVALKRKDQRILVLPEDMPAAVDQTFDLRPSMRQGLVEELMSRMMSISDALAVFTAPESRLIRIVGEPNMRADEFIDVVLPEAPLRQAMTRFALNVFILSLVISVITAALVFLALNSLFVRPIMRITNNMLYFSQRPEDASRILVPSSRTDEIGVTERELAQMQRELSQLLAQKTRLAALGLAVSKVNHDLRNMLATTQILSDRLASVNDPQVQRLAPKLIASLDRAIGFCNNTLRFGKAVEAEPQREMFELLPLLEEVAEALDLPRGNDIGWAIELDVDLIIDADREQFYRVFSNLCRNAVQAFDSQPKSATSSQQITVRANRQGSVTVIDISDNGPGIPAKAREHLFKAFQGSTRRGGSGLGLAIAQEIVTAHGGTIVHAFTVTGTTFRIELPDRVQR
jgi:signal transduction histidine kinase